MNVIIISGFILMSISLGGSMAWFFSKLFQHTTQNLFLLCGGFLLGILAIDIIPTALHMYDFLSIVLGLVIGYLLFCLLQHFFHHANPQHSSANLLIIALLIHTIPLSLTIGNLLENSTLGITLTASFILHHLPEGFALTTALLAQGEKWGKLIFYFISFSIFFGLFIWIGHYANLTDPIEGILIGVSIALIATTSISEFIIHTIRTKAKTTFLTYIFFGFLLSYLFHLVIG